MLGIVEKVAGVILSWLSGINWRRPVVHADEFEAQPLTELGRPFRPKRTSGREINGRPVVSALPDSLGHPFHEARRARLR
jgi:hypothetical protein